MILKKVLSGLSVIRHHRIWLRFIKSHSSYDHSVGAGLGHMRSLLVCHVSESHLRFDFNDLSRTICLQEGWIFPNKLILILFIWVLICCGPADLTWSLLVLMPVRRRGGRAFSRICLDRRALLGLHFNRGVVQSYCLFHVVHAIHQLIGNGVQLQ